MSTSAFTPEFGDLLKEVKKLMEEKPGKSLIGKAASVSGQPLPGKRTCCGELHIGVFFDGTGNNKDDDYGPDNKPKPFLERKHSNIVRLYNAFPDETLPWREDKPKNDKNQFRRIYVPGVGTQFDEIEDSGKGLEAGLGAGFAANGEPRILWAMIQVLNEIYRFHHGVPLFRKKDILKTVKTVAFGEKWSEKFMDRVKDASEVYNMLFTDDVKRKETFESMIEDDLIIPDGVKPDLTEIFIYTFGFSRGAAEARTFSNWMLELTSEIMTSEGSSNIRLLKGIPINFPFLGIFDTVASVGLASMYSFSEGHWGWALETQQIPREIGKCVHMVAAHEIRACFPLDSVRQDNVAVVWEDVHTDKSATSYPIGYACEKKYPGNCVEIVYPGAHSDVGGGYAFHSLGKVDVDISSRADDKSESLASGDLQISRVPGFDMYLRAKDANVPFYSFVQLKAQKRKQIAQDLLPDIRTIELMQKYVKLTNILDLPVEQQLKWHTSLYLHWRWKQGNPVSLDEKSTPTNEFQRLERDARAGYNQKDIEEQEHKVEYFRIVEDSERLREEEETLQMMHLNYDPNSPGKEKAGKELDGRQSGGLANKLMGTGVLATQRALMSVIAGYCNEIDKRIKSFDSFFTGVLNWDPLGNPHDPLPKVEAFAKGKAQGIAVSKAIYYFAEKADLGGVGKVYKWGKRLLTVYKIVKKVSEALQRDLEAEFEKNCVIAAKALEKAKEWRQALKDHYMPEFHNYEAPEREAMLLFDALAYGEKVFQKTSNVIDSSGVPCNMYEQVVDKFFSEHVHDSMAGFIIPEYTLNGYGIGKFRRLYFGNQQDMSTIVEVCQRNDRIMDERDAREEQMEKEKKEKKK